MGRLFPAHLGLRTLPLKWPSRGRLRDFPVCPAPASWQRLPAAAPDFLVRPALSPWQRPTQSGSPSSPGLAIEVWGGTSGLRVTGGTLGVRDAPSPSTRKGTGRLLRARAFRECDGFEAASPGLRIRASSLLLALDLLELLRAWEDVWLVPPPFVLSCFAKM